MISLYMQLKKKRKTILLDMKPLKWEKTRSKEGKQLNTRKCGLPKKVFTQGHFGVDSWHGVILVTFLIILKHWKQCSGSQLNTHRHPSKNILINSKKHTDYMNKMDWYKSERKWAELFKLFFYCFCYKSKST